MEIDKGAPFITPPPSQSKPTVRAEHLNVSANYPHPEQETPNPHKPNIEGEATKVAESSDGLPEKRKPKGYFVAKDSRVYWPLKKNGDLKFMGTLSDQVKVEEVKPDDSRTIGNGLLLVIVIRDDVSINYKVAGRELHRELEIGEPLIVRKNDATKIHSD